MKKNILKEFEVPILNNEYKVYVFLGDKIKAEKKIQEYLKIDEKLIDDQNRGKCMFMTAYHPCIWVDSSLPYFEAVGTLCHESIHAVMHIMNYLGMNPLDVSGDEFLAHSVGAIIRNVLRK